MYNFVFCRLLLRCRAVRSRRRLLLSQYAGGLSYVVSMPKDHIILYGGSFNPPHFSHLLFVAALGGCFPEAEIWVAPTYAHAFGKPLMDYELRLRMLEAMFAPYRHVVVSTIERDLHRSTSYTVDVVRAILAQCPGVRVSVAVGADIVPTLLQ